MFETSLAWDAAPTLSRSLIARDVTQLFPERLQSTVREELARFREQKQAEPLDLEVTQGEREVLDVGELPQVQGDECCP